MSRVVAALVSSLKRSTFPLIKSVYLSRAAKLCDALTCLFNHIHIHAKTDAYVAVPINGIKIHTRRDGHAGFPEQVTTPLFGIVGVLGNVDV